MRVIYMSVKSRMPILLIILLSLAIVIAWIFYGAFYARNEEISQTYTEVYQELEGSEVKTISIDTITHNVEIRPSQEDKIRISYYQKVESSNQYSFENGKVSLKMLEKGDELENLFYRSKRKLNTIVIYLPEESSVSITNHNVDGDLSVEGITLKSLVMNSSNGSITVSSVNCDEIKFITVFGESRVNGVMCHNISLTSNSGRAEVRDTVFSSLNISEVTGDIDVRLQDSITTYNLNLSTSYGTLKVNNRDVVEVNPETGDERIVSSMKQNLPDSSKVIVLTGIRNQISLTGDETVQPETEQTEAETEKQ